jgi:hypothetical protein
MNGDFSRLTFRPDKHHSSVRMQQGRVQLDADWNEQVDIQLHRERTTAHDVIGHCGAPIHDAGFGITPEGNDFMIGAGRYYVDGSLCENERQVSYLEQPDFTPPAPPDTAGVYLAYLDVWDRHLTALDRPELREVALGGPDTATRTKTVWQVKVVQVDDEAKCEDFEDDWAPPDTASTGQLRAKAEETEPTTDVCLVPTGAGYRRLENQLYRVEIHDSGTPETATFKWSRDNNSLVASLESIDGPPDKSVLTVSDPGKDAVLGFASARWVELNDEERALRGEPGVLVELNTVQGSALSVKTWPDGIALTMAAFGPRPTVRRWDSTLAAVTIEEWLELEGGVQIRFEDGAYQSGDYWLIPARSLTGGVDWTEDATGPLAEPRHGVNHHYCPLALLRFDGETWALESDCRRIFPPLTELPEPPQGPPPPEPGIRIEKIAGNGVVGLWPLENDMDVPPWQIRDGITISFSDRVDPASVQDKPTCFVTLDLPYPFTDDLIGSLPVTLAGYVIASGNEIMWRPTPSAQQFLMSGLPFPRISRIPAHLTLKGSFIWAEGNPNALLDGDSFGRPHPHVPGQTDVRLPSGDNRRGGDFELWFWLVGG